MQIDLNDEQVEKQRSPTLRNFEPGSKVTETRELQPVKTPLPRNCRLAGIVIASSRTQSMKTCGQMSTRWESTSKVTDSREEQFQKQFGPMTPREAGKHTDRMAVLFAKTRS
jgi:hypothetical protein